MEKKYIIGLSIVLLVLVIAMVIMFQWIINFKFTGDEDSVKIVSSVIVFWGGLITAVITLFGVLLKHSTDTKNNNLKAEAENRLKLEAGIKAIELLSESADKTVCENRRSAVLHMLTSLKMHELALALLQQMLAKEQIDALTAAQILDQCLRLRNEELNKLSAEMFRDYSSKLLTDNGGAETLESLSMKWPLELGLYIKQSLQIGLMKLLLSRPYKEWDRETFNSFIYTFYIISQTETDTHIKNAIGLFTKETLSLYNDKTYFYTSEGSISIESMLLKLSDITISKCLKLETELIKKMKTWCTEAKKDPEFKLQ
jgi:hypothetical protein